MDEEKVVKVEEENKPWEYKLGYRIGSIAVYVILGCCAALAVGITIKILQWMLFQEVV